MRWMVLSCAALLVGASGCNQADETTDPTSEEPSGCVRPAGYPAGYGYIGPVGEHGCDAGDACIIFPDRDEGKCYGPDEVTEPCTISGKSATEALAAWSQHCDETDAALAVCNVPAGEWMGSCGPLADEQTADGILPDACETPSAESSQSFPFTVAVGEVLRFDIGFSPNSAPSGVNARALVVAEPGDVPLTRSNNDLGIDEVAVYDQPIDASLLHGFGLAGDRAWNVVRSGGCAEVPFHSTIDRLAPAIAHLSPTTAAPLAKGVTVAGHLGCSEQLGDTSGSLDHYFAIAVATGETIHLTFTALPFTTGVGPGSLPYAALLDSAGNPVQRSGNDFSVGPAPESNTGTDDIEVDPGNYYLRVTQDGFGCSVMRYTLSY